MTYPRIRSALLALLLLACGPEKDTSTDSTSTDTTVSGDPTEVDPTEVDPTEVDPTETAAACGDEPAFQASLTAWTAALAENGADYFYTIRHLPGFADDGTGCSYRTTNVVKAGVVVERRFEIVDDTMTEDPCQEPFIELGEQVGIHAADLPAKPATLDELYTACCAEAFLKEPADELTVFFKTDPAGLIHECYYEFNGCDDGCDGGPFGESLRIETLAFGQPPPVP